jgi:hypothetical protein
MASFTFGALGNELTEGQADNSANKANEKRARTMKKFLAAAGVGAALAAGSLGLAGTASAKTYYPSGSKGDQSVVAYHHELTYAGLSANLDTAARQGQKICTDLSNGFSENTLISVQIAPPYPKSATQAQVVVFGAEWHFCPSYY